MDTTEADMYTEEAYYFWMESKMQTITSMQIVRPSNYDGESDDDYEYDDGKDEESG